MIRFLVQEKQLYFQNLNLLESHRNLGISSLCPNNWIGISNCSVVDIFCNGRVKRILK